jgi:hypothetical protein
MKNKKEKLEYRMYGLVPYNISPIQQGIQFGHAVVEYGFNYGKTDEYQKWAKHDKTFIILNGGTTNNSGYLDSMGTMNKHLVTLQEKKTPLALFHEPDLGNQLTGIVFLVDERVFNKDKYPLDTFEPDPENFWTENIPKKELRKILFLREFLVKFRLA